MTIFSSSRDEISFDIFCFSVSSRRFCLDDMHNRESFRFNLFVRETSTMMGFREDNAHRLGACVWVTKRWEDNDEQKETKLQLTENNRKMANEKKESKSHLVITRSELFSIISVVRCVVSVTKNVKTFVQHDQEPIISFSARFDHLNDGIASHKSLKSWKQSECIDRRFVHDSTKISGAIDSLTDKPIRTRWSIRWALLVIYFESTRKEETRKR